MALQITIISRLPALRKTQGGGKRRGEEEGIGRLRLTKRLVSLIQWRILEFNGDADALDRFIACARRRHLARANSMAEWCSEPLWKIRLQGRCCRLDHYPFPADEAC